MIEGEYPSLVKRYLSSSIDGGLLLGAMILSAIAFHTENELTIRLRFFSVLILFLIYEPFLVSYSCTLGQKLMGIRVRNVDDHKKKINLLQSYIRLFLKLFLGSLSFLALLFSKQRRAIHDYAAKSIVLKAGENISA